MAAGAGRRIFLKGCAIESGSSGEDEISRRFHAVAFGQCPLVIGHLGFNNPEALHRRRHATAVVSRPPEAFSRLHLRADLVKESCEKFRIRGKRGVRARRLQGFSRSCTVVGGPVPSPGEVFTAPGGTLHPASRYVTRKAPKEFQ